MLIDKEKLKDIIPGIAEKTKFRPAIVEKDYYLTVILNNIESLLTGNIVFKGGTLLSSDDLTLLPEAPEGYNWHRDSSGLNLDGLYIGRKTNYRLWNSKFGHMPGSDKV